MTIGLEADGKYLFVTGDVMFIEDDRDVASKWAAKYVTSNPAIRWLVGKYAEADRANSNKQFWSLSDMQDTHTTINHSPLNVLHRPRFIVGTFVGTEIVYPTTENGDGTAMTAAGTDPAHPYIEALAAIWRYYFPDELKVIESAYNAGQLALSMECVAEQMHCGGPDGCDAYFPYKGPKDASYCEHLNNDISNHHMVNPLWLGAGLILPPAQPGWKDARVLDMAQDKALAEFVYASLQEEVPEGTPQVWEMQMVQVLSQYNNMKKGKKPKKKMATAAVAPAAPAPMPADGCPCCGASPQTPYCAECGASQELIMAGMPAQARDFTVNERMKLAKKGHAMPDGSFPIMNGADLKNAIQAIGRAKDPAAAKAHIKKRAAALGLTDMIPANW